MTKKTKTEPEDLFDDEEVIDEVPDDAMAELEEVAPKLTIQERKYVFWRLMAIPPLASYKRAGYKGTQWRMVESRPKIREAIADMHERIAPEHRITQKKIIGILMDAVDMASRKEQAGNLIEAARALADISGVGAAAKIQIQNDVSVTHKQEVLALKQLPRAELEGLLELNRALPNPAVIEGEYTEV